MDYISLLGIMGFELSASLHVNIPYLNLTEKTDTIAKNIYMEGQNDPLWLINE